MGYNWHKRFWKAGNKSFWIAKSSRRCDGTYQISWRKDKPNRVIHKRLCGLKKYSRKSALHMLDYHLSFGKQAQYPSSLRKLKWFTRITSQCSRIALQAKSYRIHRLSKTKYLKCLKFPISHRFMLTCQRLKNMFNLCCRTRLLRYADTWQTLKNSTQACWTRFGHDMAPL